MLYALLIYSPEREWAGKSMAERQLTMDSHIKAAQIEHADGALLAGIRLRPTPFATTVRATPNGIAVTDGPFAETKEQFGGFQLVDCPGLDDALRYARQLVEHGGTVEVRPVHPSPMTIE